MGIKVAYEDNLFCPQFHCDICGKRLIDAKGRYAYVLSDTQPTDIYILCGASCHNFVDNKHNTKLLWMPIKNLVVNLWANLEFGITDFTDFAKRMI
jgi:hypothetical protein